jgi:hypothetical protein
MVTSVKGSNLCQVSGFLLHFSTNKTDTSYSPLHWSLFCYSCGVTVSFIGGGMYEKTTDLTQVTPLYTGHHSVTPVV